MMLLPSPAARIPQQDAVELFIPTGRWVRFSREGRGDSGERAGTHGANGGRGVGSQERGGRRGWRRAVRAGGAQALPAPPRRCRAARLSEIRSFTANCRQTRIVSCVRGGGRR